MGGDFPSRYCSATDQSPAPPSTPPPSSPASSVFCSAATGRPPPRPATLGAFLFLKRPVPRKCREVLVFPPLQGRHGLVGAHKGGAVDLVAVGARQPHRRCRSPAAGRSRACASTPRCRWASRRCPWSKPSTCVCARAATAAAAAAVAATAATATRPCAGAGKRLRRARAAVPEASSGHHSSLYA